MEMENVSSDESVGDPAPKIKITVSEEGIPLIWDAEDWMTIRQVHRIVGNLIGLSVPYPYNEGVNGLPMTLQPWETTFLVNHEIAELIYYPELSQAPDEGVKEQFENYRENIVQGQIDCFLEERKKEVYDKLEDIAKGKNQKGKSKMKKLPLDSGSINGEPGPSTSAGASAEVDKSLLLQEELSKIKPLSPESTLVQTPTKCPWLPDSGCKVHWQYPSNPKEHLQYCVFEDLWQRGYYVTSGEKFGSDFLVYPGDPCKFHAHFLVVCVEKDAAIRPSELVTLCRLGNSVHKTAAFAFIMDDNVMYHSLTWLPNTSD